MHGKSFYMGWTADEGGKVARVWNGTAWHRIQTQAQSREAGKLFPHAVALKKLNQLRIRFPDVEEISVVPIAEWRPKIN